MSRTVLIETVKLDEPALRQRLAALGEPGAWQVQPLGEGWLLRLDTDRGAEQLCGRLLACGWVRRLDFAASAG